MEAAITANIAANAALIEFIAEWLRVRRSAVSIVSGALSELLGKIVSEMLPNN